MRRLRSWLVLMVCALALAACDDTPHKPRQAQTVKLLPDTPPPPPPPPKPEEKRPEPPRQDKPQPQPLAPPKPEPMQAQALKSDEAAGQGPGNGLTAGSVSQDYAGGPVGNAVQIGGGAPEIGGAQRLAASTYANAATRALNEYLVREKDLKQQDWRVQVNVWLLPDGSMQRAELVGSTGSVDTDAALRRALERFPGTRAPLPDRMPLPLRLQVSNRMMG